MFQQQQLTRVIPTEFILSTQQNKTHLFKTIVRCEWNLTSRDCVTVKGHRKKKGGVPWIPHSPWRDVTINFLEEPRAFSLLTRFWFIFIHKEVSNKFLSGKYWNFLPFEIAVHILAKMFHFLCLHVSSSWMFTKLVIAMSCLPKMTGCRAKQKKSDKHGSGKFTIHESKFRHYCLVSSSRTI